MDIYGDMGVDAWVGLAPQCQILAGLCGVLLIVCGRLLLEIKRQNQQMRADLQSTLEMQRQQAAEAREDAVMYAKLQMSIETLARR